MLNQYQDYLTLENIYLWTNFGILPFWIALIVIPNSRFSRIFIKIGIQDIDIYSY